MTNRFNCPGCHVELAFSPALAGRTVRCHHCDHQFAVPDSEGAGQLELVAASSSSANLSPPSLPRRLNPPPLPAREQRSAEEWDAPVESVFLDGGDLDNDADPVTAGPIEIPAPGAKSVLGLIASLAFGLLILSAGIGYLIWPGSSRSTSSTMPSAAPPGQVPVEVEQPKSLDEILNNGLKGEPMPPPPNEGFGRPKRPGPFVK